MGFIRIALGMAVLLSPLPVASLAFRGGGLAGHRLRHVSGLSVAAWVAGMVVGWLVTSSVLSGGVLGVVQGALIGAAVGASSG
mgnify:CR=1 FL=1